MLTFCLHWQNSLTAGCFQANLAKVLTLSDPRNHSLSKFSHGSFFLTWVNGTKQKRRILHQIAKLIYIKCKIDVYQIIKREPIFSFQMTDISHHLINFADVLKDKKIVVWMTNWQRWTNWAVARLISRFLWCWAAVAPPWQRRRPRRPNHRWCSLAFLKG